MRWLSVLPAVLLLTACHRVPDEQRIREAIASMQMAVEARDTRAFMHDVSADFTGNDGQVDHDGLQNLLRVEVLRNDSVGVMLGPMDVDLQGDRATVRVTVTLTGSSGGLLLEHGSIYSITTGWKREGGGWRCINAKWEQKF